MVELPVPPQEIHHIYTDLIKDVSSREQRISEDLPIETAAGLPSYLQDVVDNWEHNRKSLRTVPVCNVFVRECERPTPDDVEQLLTGLDATVNVFDDIIDTQGLSTESKVALTANAAFSAVLMIDSCPAGERDAVNKILLEYFTALFQVPLVERQLFEQMTAATTIEERRDAAEAIYAYRGRDIDAFARLTAAVMGVDDEAERRLLEDLRTYRSRRLLFKDIADVKRDLADGDTTPLIHFLRTSDTTDEVVDEVGHLYNRFSYSERGRDCYGDILEAFEDPPENLHDVIHHTRETVLSPIEEKAHF